MTHIQDIGNLLLFLQYNNQSHGCGHLSHLPTLPCVTGLILYEQAMDATTTSGRSMRLGSGLCHSGFTSQNVN